MQPAIFINSVQSQFFHVTVKLLLIILLNNATAMASHWYHNGPLLQQYDRCTDSIMYLQKMYQSAVIVPVTCSVPCMASVVTNILPVYC